MGRVLKRVPMDFNHPIGTLWEGYAPSLEKLQGIEGIVNQVPEILEYEGNICSQCDEKFNNCDEDARYCVWYNNDLRSLWYYEPPAGDGFQLWETTTEGSPQSPVFETLEALCEWCAENANTFANYKATKEEWMKMLSGGNVHHTEGNITFM